MKKLLILSALVLMAGIYSFQKEVQVSNVQVEEDQAKTVKATRSVASIPRFEEMPMVSNSLTGSYDVNDQPENDQINCLNSAGGDACPSNDFNQDTYSEETYAQMDQESQTVVEEPIPDETAGMEMDSESQENALFASAPLTHD